MKTFSEQTIKCLYSAGWSEDRRVDTAEYERILQTADYPVHPEVKEFLRRFGGLQVVHPHAALPAYDDYFHFDVAKAVSSEWPLNVQSCGNVIGASLCIIGMSHREYMTLMMDPSGKVYALYVQLFYVGESGEDAIEALCTGRDLPKIERR
jgi:hypothetical protein